MPTIWAIIAFVSLLNASFGAALVPSIDFGGFCFFSSRPPALYGNLVIFLPRTGLFIAVIVLYVKLALFFRRQSGRAKKTESGLAMTCSLAAPAMPGQPILFPLAEHVFSGAMSDRQGARDPHQHSGSHALGASRTSDIPGHRIYEVASLRDQLAEYRMSEGDSSEDGKESGEKRKASKDSQSTLVDGPGLHLRRPEFVRSISSKPDMSSVKEEGMHSSPRLSGAPASPSLIMQDSDAILSGDAGFGHQLVLLEASVTSSPRISLSARTFPSPSPALSSREGTLEADTPYTRLESSSPGLAPSHHEGMSHPTYRFPAVRSTSATDTTISQIVTPFSTDSSSPLFRSGSVRTPVEGDDSPIQIGPSVSYTFPQTVPALSGSTLEGLPPIDGPSRTALNTPMEDGTASKHCRQQSGELSLERSKTGGRASSHMSGSADDADGIGFWEALANVEPHIEGAPGVGEPYVDRGRRMSASEENRRVAYLMMLYPLAVSATIFSSNGLGKKLIERVCFPVCGHRCGLTGAHALCHGHGPASKSDVGHDESRLRPQHRLHRRHHLHYRRMAVPSGLAHGTVKASSFCLVVMLRLPPHLSIYGSAVSQARSDFSPIPGGPCSAASPACFLSLSAWVPYVHRHVVLYQQPGL